MKIILKRPWMGNPKNCVLDLGENTAQMLIDRGTAALFTNGKPTTGIFKKKPGKQKTVRGAPNKMVSSSADK